MCPSVIICVITVITEECVTRRQEHASVLLGLLVKTALQVSRTSLYIHVDIIRGDGVSVTVGEAPTKRGTSLEELGTDIG